MHKSITLDRVEAAVKREMFETENPGFCIKCGNEQEGCEPDARKYKCDECGERKVFGAAEILLYLVA